LNALRAVLNLFLGLSEGVMTLALGIVSVFVLAYSVATCILLLRSQAVSDFLYKQKNG